MVFFIEIGNDGSIPVPGSKIYGTLIDIDLDGNESEEYKYKVEYEKFKIDRHYIKMVIDLMENPFPYIHITSDHKGEINYIHNVALKHNISSLAYYHVYSDVENWRQFIIGLGTFGDHSFKNETLMAIIETYISRIRDNMEEARKNF
jgi:hypothetical protein